MHLSIIFVKPNVWMWNLNLKTWEKHSYKGAFALLHLVSPTLLRLGWIRQWLMSPPVRLTRKAKYVTMTVSLCKVQRLTSLRCRGVVNAMARDRWLTKEEGTKQTDIVSSSAWWLMGALGSFVNPSITTWLTHSPWFWSLYFMTGTVKHVFLHHGWHFAAPEGMSDLVSK